MKRFNYLKMALDILMAVVLALLFNTRLITGLSFHEIAGLAIGLAFIIHKAMNGQWIKQVTLNIFRRGIQVKTRLRYIVDILLLGTMVYIIVSGVLISKYLLPNLRLGNEFFFRSTHMPVAYMSLLFVGIHIGLNWLWVMNTFQRIRGNPERKICLNYMAKAAAILILVVGGYHIGSTDYFSRVAKIGSGFRQNHFPGRANGFQGEPSRGRGWTEYSPQTDRGFRGDRPNDGVRPEKGFGGEHGGKAALANIGETLISFLSIMAFFATITYYMKKLFSRRRVKKKGA